MVRNAEQDYKNHRIKDLYRKVNSLSKDFKLNEKCLRNKDGTLLMNREDVTNKWADYFDQLLNCKEPQNPFHFEGREPNIEHLEPTIEDILSHIKTIKNHKAPGQDKITGELLKIGANDVGW